MRIRQRAAAPAHGQEVAVLVNRAALNQNIRPKRGQRLLEAGSAIDDDELRRLQAAIDEAVEERPPGGFASAALPSPLRRRLGSSIS